MSRLLAPVLWCLIAAYPLLVLYGLRSLSLNYVGVMLVVLALMRLWFLRRASEQRTITLALTLILLLVAVYSMLTASAQGLRYYPVAVNAAFLLVFAGSLRAGPPIVERIARMREGELSAAAVRYTRRVTFVWCIFFLLNGSAALYTAVFSSFEQWAWYNGAVAYLLIAALFSAEWLVRRRLRRVIDAQAQ